MCRFSGSRTSPSIELKFTDTVRSIESANLLTLICLKYGAGGESSNPWVHYRPMPVDSTFLPQAQHAVSGSENNLLTNTVQQYCGESSNPWVQEYASRLSFLVSDTSCGIRISQPHANDTGIYPTSLNFPENKGNKLYAFFTDGPATLFSLC